MNCRVIVDTLDAQCRVRGRVDSSEPYVSTEYGPYSTIDRPRWKVTAWLIISGRRLHVTHFRSTTTSGQTVCRQLQTNQPTNLSDSENKPTTDASEWCINTRWAQRI